MLTDEVAEQPVRLSRRQRALAGTAAFVVGAIVVVFLSVVWAFVNPNNVDPCDGLTGIDKSAFYQQVRRD